MINSTMEKYLSTAIDELMLEQGFIFDGNKASLDAWMTANWATIVKNAMQLQWDTYNRYIANQDEVTTAACHRVVAKIKIKNLVEELQQVAC